MKKHSESIVKYNKLLSACKKNRDDSAFFRLTYELIFNQESSLPYPDSVTFNIVIDYLGKKNAIADMFDFFFFKMESGFRPTIITFGSMLNGIARSKEFLEDATLLQYLNYIIQFMNMMGIRPNHHIYRAIHKCGWLHHIKPCLSMV